MIGTIFFSFVAGFSLSSYLHEYKNINVFKHLFVKTVNKDTPPTTTTTIDDEVQSPFLIPHPTTYSHENIDTYFAKPLGNSKYATLGINNYNDYIEVNPLNNRSKSSKQSVDKQKLSRSDELKIISEFRKYEGMLYNDAIKEISNTEYVFHPIYVNNNHKKERSEYSNKAIGVRIQYPADDFNKAMIMEIIDVGGIDEINRGFAKSN